MSTLKRAIQENKDTLTNKIRSRQEMIKINSLLYFEPYACLSTEMIVNLVQERENDDEIPDSVLYDCASIVHPNLAHLKETLLLPQHNTEYVLAADGPGDQYSNDPAQKCFHVFKTWKKFTENLTYKGLRETLDKYSVFRGRSPLVSV